MAMKKQFLTDDDLKDALKEARKQDFITELNEALKREFPKDGYSCVEVSVCSLCTEIIIRAPDSQNQLHRGERETRVRELVSALQKRLKFPETGFKLFFDFDVPLTGGRSATVQHPALDDGPWISDEDMNELQNLLERKNQLRREFSDVYAKCLKLLARVFIVSVATLVPAFVIAHNSCGAGIYVSRILAVGALAYVLYLLPKILVLGKQMWSLMSLDASIIAKMNEIRRRLGLDPM